MRIETLPLERHRAPNLAAGMDPPGMSDIPEARELPGSSTPGDLMPAQTAQRLVEWSVAKSALSADRLIVLGLLAGAFIAIGGAFFTGVIAESSLGHGPSRLLGGIVFS